MLGFALFSAALSAKSIVVFGDSLSAAYGMEVQQGWVAQLQQRLRQSGKDYTLINESISGETTAGGLARIDQVLERYRPELLILELGANDGLRGLSPRIMKNNLTEMIQRAQRAGSQVLLLSMRIPPNYGKRYTDMFYQVYPQLAEEMRIVFVPFILKDVALKKDMMQPDGLHPNENAQSLIVENIWPYLEPLL